MGRGRAKAKQQKVARELKYSQQFTDLDALQRELGTSDSGRDGMGHGPPDRSGDDDEFDDGSGDYERWTGTER